MIDSEGVTAALAGLDGQVDPPYGMEIAYPMYPSPPTEAIDRAPGRPLTTRSPQASLRPGTARQPQAGAFVS